MAFGRLDEIKARATLVRLLLLLLLCPLCFNVNVNGASQLLCNEFEKNQYENNNCTHFENEMTCLKHKLQTGTHELLLDVLSKNATDFSVNM